MRLPNPPPLADQTLFTYLTTLVKNITQQSPPPGNTPKESILLVSPNRSVYSVEVTDAGVLQTTLIQEGTP